MVPGRVPGVPCPVPFVMKWTLPVLVIVAVVGCLLLWFNRAAAPEKPTRTSEFLHIETIITDKQGHVIGLSGFGSAWMLTRTADGTMCWTTVPMLDEALLPTDRPWMVKPQISTKATECLAVVDENGWVIILHDFLEPYALVKAADGTVAFKQIAVREASPGAARVPALESPRVFSVPRKPEPVIGQD